jgi:tRNA pseudouridine55 synthase
MDGNDKNGIIVIDKPPNISSARVVAIVKKLIRARKVGHTGTLDPFATGVMICCVNQATRLARFFLQGKKKYSAVLQLGVETDTQDATGRITSTCTRTYPSETTIQTVFKRFTGEVEQFPPVYSALKHNGVPLYQLARRGEPVQKAARKVVILALDILEINLPQICFEVKCSAGTYIRTLCADIGTALGCGGHLKELRRIESSGFTINEAISLSELERLVLSGNLSDVLLRMNIALRDIPEFIADKTLTDRLMHGNIITEKDFSLGSCEGRMENTAEFIKVVDSNHDLIAVLNRGQESGQYSYCCVFPKIGK